MMFYWQAEGGFPSAVERNAERLTMIGSTGMTHTVLRLGFTVAAMTWSCGCAVHARVQLSAADALEALAGALQQSAVEYHGEIRTADDMRRREVINAFVRRVRSDHKDENRIERHVAEFNGALERIHLDVQLELTRHAATLQNVRTVTEIAQDLRRLAVESMSLDDEMRRYVTDLLIRTGDAESEP